MQGIFGVTKRANYRLIKDFKTTARLESITLPITMDDSEYESLPTEKVTVHLAAGALAGVMEHCVMYPVDVVKVRSVRFTGFLSDFNNSSP